MFSAMRLTTVCPQANNVDTASSTIVNCNVTTLGTITDINVELEVGDHYIDDLKITLVHNAISVVVYNGSADSYNAVMDATFDDDAANPPPVAGSVIGDFKPFGPGTLADFNGGNAFGLWQLFIIDETISPGDGNDLTKFNLIITTDTPVSEPATLALFGLGIAGLGVARRRKAA